MDKTAWVLVLFTNRHEAYVFASQETNSPVDSLGGSTMTWRAFGKRVRRFTRFVTFGLVSSFLTLGLSLGESQGDSLQRGVTLAMLAATLLMLVQNVRGLRIINRLILQMDDLQANWGGLLIPDP